MSSGTKAPYLLFMEKAVQICLTSPRKNEVEELGGAVDWSFMLLTFPLALLHTA